ncbi:unnamed protein product [Linum trigynum]|uniref:Uncharacterized protein n=1 Tax=Linum trigynum TaxID=586398 RepID=A0AAV2G7T4_9ROSI
MALDRDGTVGCSLHIMVKCGDTYFDEGVVGLEDSKSDGEGLQFELKSRAPLSTVAADTQAHAGHVRQVVRAFETGMLINKDGEGSSFCLDTNLGSLELDAKLHEDEQEMVAKLNEYGSNLVDSWFGGRKRMLQEVDGDIGDYPTQKKQFVEV